MIKNITIDIDNKDIKNTINQILNYQDDIEQDILVQFENVL